MYDPILATKKLPLTAWRDAENAAVSQF